MNGKTIDLTGDNIIIQSDNFSLDETGRVTATAGEIGGYEITENYFTSDIYPLRNYTEEDTQKIINYISGTGTLTEEEKQLYDLSGDGVINTLDLVLMRQLINANVTTEQHGRIYINKNDPVNTIVIKDKDGVIRTRLGLLRVQADNIVTNNLSANSIQSGVESIKPEANTPTSVDVEFETEFSTVPTVVATPLTGVPGREVTGVGVSDITTTGFRLIVTRINATTTNVNWIAIG